MRRFLPFKLSAILAGLVVASFALGVYAQPVISEMKIKVHDYWIEIVYDVTPGTVGDAILARFDGTNTSNTLAGDVRVCDTTDGCPTINVATANGELFVEGDLEADGNLNVAGTSIHTGATTVTGDLDIDGGAGALDFTGSGASSVLLADNDTTALIFGSTGLLNLLTLDTGDATETVVVTGTTATNAFVVDVGDALFDEDITCGATITSTATGDLGWAVVDGTDNTACTSQCTNAAVFGFDLAAGATAPVLVGPASATADICVCAGAG